MARRIGRMHDEGGLGLNLSLKQDFPDKTVLFNKTSNLRNSGHDVAQLLFLGRENLEFRKE